MNRHRLAGFRLAALVSLGWLGGCFGTAGRDSSDGSSRTLFVDFENNTGQAIGTKTSPFLTIQDALDEASNGDTIQVAPGVYLEQLTIEVGVTIRGDVASNTSLEGTGTSTLFEVSKGVRGLVFEDFAFRGGFSDTGAVADIGGADLTCRRCLFTDHETGGGGEVFNAATLRLKNDGAFLLEQCVFLDNATAGVTFVTPNSAVVDQCLFAMLEGRGIFVTGDSTSQSPDVRIVQCTFAGLTENAIFLQAFGDTFLRNNILETEPAGLLEGVTAGDPPLFYNDFVGGYFDRDIDRKLTTAEEINGLAPPTGNRGNLVAPAEFVDPGGADYRLLATSPCVDTGDPDRRDADGSRSDMGIFGGSGSDFDPTFAASDGEAASLGFVPSMRSDLDLAQLLDLSPTRGTRDRPHACDIDGDGRVDRISTDVQGRLRLWLGTDGGVRAAPVPPALHDAVAWTTWDADGDGRLDLIVETAAVRGTRDVSLHWNRRRVPAPIAVVAHVGDVIECALGDERPVRRRTVSPRGDRDDGALLFGLGRVPSATVTVYRDDRPIARWLDVASGTLLELRTTP